MIARAFRVYRSISMISYETLKWNCSILHINIIFLKCIFQINISSNMRAFSLSKNDCIRLYIVGIVCRIVRICSLECTRRECIIGDVQIITAWKTAAYLLLFFLWQTFKNIINIRVHSDWWGKYNIWSRKMSCNSMKHEELFKAGNFILLYERQENNSLGLCLLT